jgi:light-regulated signal transduction histidine kinase (bacteriophytochrome)
MNFIYKLEATHEAAFKRLSNENVYSAVQCIIGSKEDVRGICSFELINYKKMFAHDEIMIYSMFTNMVGMILDAK